MGRRVAVRATVAVYWCQCFVVSAYILCLYTSIGIADKVNLGSGDLVSYYDA